MQVRGVDRASHIGAGCSSPGPDDPLRRPAARSGAASGVLNSTQQVGGSLGLPILVTAFGTASRNEADQQVPTFLARADPAEKALFARTGRLPPARGNQILTSDVSADFIVAAAFAWSPFSPSRSAPPK